MISTLRVWFFTQIIVLLTASLWLVPAPEWQLLLFGLAILANIVNRVSWKIWLLRIFPLLLLLLLFQVFVTPYSRPLLHQLRMGEFDFSAWWPLIHGLLRLGTPFLAVSAFSRRFSRPELVKDLAALLSPLRWLGINVQRNQMILPLGLRFFPMVLESSKQTREILDLFMPFQPEGMRLMTKMRYWGMLYKSTFIQTLNSALQVGETLALRGWQTASSVSYHRRDWIWGGVTLGFGIGLSQTHMVMFTFWLIMMLWMGLCLLDLHRINHAHRAIA